jgi:hypothetical protein
MSRWFRHYVGMTRDPKFVGIAVRSKQPVAQVIFIWNCILESAAEANAGGTFSIDEDEIAYFLRCERSDVDAIMAAMTEAGLHDGQQILSWSKRQFESDSDPTAAERKARQREKAKKTNGKNDVTSKSRVTPTSVTGGSHPPDNSVSGSDSGDDGDLEPTDAGASACTREVRLSLEEAFAIWWKIWPHKVGIGGKYGARNAFRQVYDEKGVSLHILISATQEYIKTKPRGQRYKNPATWLNQECYLDKPAPDHGVLPLAKPQTNTSFLLNINGDFYDEPDSSVPIERSSAAYVAGFGESGEGISLASPTGGFIDLLAAKTVGSG